MPMWVRGRWRRWCHPVIAGAIDFGPGFIAVLAAVGLLALVVCFLIGSISPATPWPRCSGRTCAAAARGTPARRTRAGSWASSGVSSSASSTCSRDSCPAGSSPGSWGDSVGGLWPGGGAGAHVQSAAEVAGRQGVATTLGVRSPSRRGSLSSRWWSSGSAWPSLKRVGEASVVTCLVLVVVGVLQGAGRGPPGTVGRDRCGGGSS